tara:strand:- start:810 stop:1190 length:381 start_codon:yes stop_codon:yes gene_type:complete
MYLLDLTTTLSLILIVRISRISTDSNFSQNVILQAYVLAFSAIMLNTDAHNKNVAKDRKMNLDDFKENVRQALTEVRTSLVYLAFYYLFSRSILYLFVNIKLDLIFQLKLSLKKSFLVTVAERTGL